MTFWALSVLVAWVVREVSASVVLVFREVTEERGGDKACPRAPRWHSRPGFQAMMRGELPRVDSGIRLLWGCLSSQFCAALGRSLNLSESLACKMGQLHVMASTSRFSAIYVESEFESRSNQGILASLQ